MAGATDRAEGSVKRRRVFYIPGYDPFHPRRYRELYRKESAAQAAISGYDIALIGGQGNGPHGWQVQARIDGQDVVADVEVLVWSDLVRSSMAASIPATYGQLLRTAWIYIVSGALRRLMWLRKGPVIAALYPLGMLLGQLALALALGALAGRMAVAGVDAALGMGGWAIGAGAALLYWPVMAVVCVLLLRWFKARDNRVYAYYLMHDYAWTARWHGAYPPALEMRLAAFADRVAAALRGGHDEVLVVGHSSGAHLAVSVLADLVRTGRVPQGRAQDGAQGGAQGAALGLLTLGQVVPMVSFLPRAGRLRADLAFLSVQDAVTWVDVTAPGDGCAFALCDPVAVSGVAPEGKRWPLVMSAAFTRSLTPARWKALRWRFFRLHFQYLCAFDAPRDYDYFQITAGPVTLAARYADRPPSKSRIDVPASKYTSMAA